MRVTHRADVRPELANEEVPREEVVREREPPITDQLHLSVEHEPEPQS